MSVQYRGKVPDRNYTVNDFYNNGVVISWFAKFKTYEGHVVIRCIFRSNGLLGEIRTTCYGDTFAVDVWWGWWTNEQTCLTTECHSLREAKSILFEWFKSKGFAIPRKVTSNDWSKNHLRYQDVQLNLNPIVFR